MSAASEMMPDSEVSGMSAHLTVQKVESPHRFTSGLTMALSILAGLFMLSCSQTVSAPGKAVVFGINAYSTVKPVLRYCVPDANSVASLLAARGIATVDKFTDMEATKASMRVAIANTQLSSDSVLIIYFSGHGTVRDGEYYIVPQDATMRPETWISASELASWLIDVGSDKIVIILDSCYSGGFIGDSGAAVDTTPANIGGNAIPAFPLAALTRFAELLGRNAVASGKPVPIILSAAGSAEESWESGSYGHGIFTYYLLESAVSGDRDGDGNVTVSEAYAYASAAIESSWNARNTPFLPHISGGTRDLVLFRKR